MSTEITFYDLPVVEVELPGYLHIGIPGENGATFTPNVDDEGILSWSNDKELENPESVDLKLLLEKAAAKDLEEIRQDIADLQYEPIAISSFKNDVGTVEIGTEITAVTLNWATSKTPVSMTLDGEAVDIGEGATLFNQSLSYPAGEGIADDKKWTLEAVDERGIADTATTSIKFLNGVYYGALAHGADIDSDAILSLSKKLQSSMDVSFNYTPSEGKRPAYACPTRYGTPTFKIGGFEYEWEKVSTFQFRNASGYTESYDVWMHGQDVSGSITVNVT